MLSLVSIIFLSHMIFDIEVITNDKKMKENIIIELKKYGVSKYKFKKSYSDTQIIKKKIKNKYKHSIDWIEIENIGTKYIVRYEPRIENKIDKDLPLRNIVAKKSGIIYKLDVSSGEIVKYKDSYVNKGDVIVSGYIHLNDSIKDTVAARGKVFAYVWYEVKVKYPLNYYSKKKTGNSKYKYVLRLINKDIELSIHKYKYKTVKSKTIIKDNLLPFKLESQKQYELKIIDKKYKPKEALKQAIKESKKKIKKRLQKDEFISEYKVLDYNVDNNILNSTIFYVVCEDITSYQTIEKYNNELNESIN